VWLLWLVLLWCVSALLAIYGLTVASVARERRSVRETLLRADFHAAHESIPINEERRDRELRQLREIWALS
jgi:hypothetical protein